MKAERVLCGLMPDIIRMLLLPFALSRDRASAPRHRRPSSPPSSACIFDRESKRPLTWKPKARRALFRKAVELDRENPLGYAFLALAHMFAYEMSFDPKERAREQESMLQDVDEALARGQKRIEKNARNGQAYFAMALAKIVKIRWAIAQKSYFTIIQETAAIWDYLEKAKAEDPQNYDVYFSMGLLHYHLDHLPAAARFFSSLFITAARPRKGPSGAGAGGAEGGSAQGACPGGTCLGLHQFRGTAGQGPAHRPGVEGKVPPELQLRLRPGKHPLRAPALPGGLCHRRGDRTGDSGGQAPLCAPAPAPVLSPDGKNPVQSEGISQGSGVFSEGPGWTRRSPTPGHGSRPSCASG